MWTCACRLAQPITFPGVQTQYGDQQPGRYRLENLLVVRLALAGCHQLGHSLGGELAPRICASRLKTVLGASCCGLQGCFGKPGTACTDPPEQGLIGSYLHR